MGDGQHRAADLSAALAEWQKRNATLPSPTTGAGCVHVWNPRGDELKERCRLCRHRAWARPDPSTHVISSKYLRHLASIPHVAEQCGVFVWDLARAVRAAKAVDGIAIKPRRVKKRGRWNKKLEPYKQVMRAESMVAQWEKRIADAHKMRRKWERRLKLARKAHAEDQEEKSVRDWLIPPENV